MQVPDWLVPPAVVALAVIQGLLAVDRWVHKRDGDSATLVAGHRRLEEEAEKMEAVIVRQGEEIHSLRVDVAHLKGQSERDRTGWRPLPSDHRRRP